jgi:peptide/nickel transport system substrate-binding protein
MTMSAPTAGAAKQGAVDPNGVLKRPIDMNTNGGISFDPATMGTGEYVYAYPVLGGLLLRNADGSYSPELATKVDVTDPSTIVVTLQKGLVFSNGETLDATAAVNSINRTIAAKAPGLRVAEMGLVKSVTVNTPTQFTITLTSPAAGQFYPLLADAETSPVAPASIAANTKTSKTVIGAGPFKIDSYTPGVGVKFSKNDKFYAAKSVKLGGYQMVHVATGPGNLVTALRSNAVDWVSNALPFSDTASMTKPITVVEHPQAAPYLVNMCIKDGTPLGNLQVRQALNYATDRNEINQKLYNGQSAPAWTLFPSSDQFGNKSLDNVYKYNPTKAKQLLAQAGYPNGFELTVITAPAGDAATIDQIIQAQWAKVGVKANLQVSNNLNADWYANPKGQTNTVPMIREGVSRLTRLVTSDAFANVCKFPVPQIDAIASQLSGLATDDPGAAKLWKQADELWTKTYVDGVPTVFVLQNIAYNADRVGGVAYHTDAIMQWEPDLTKLYIKKSA